MPVLEAHTLQNDAPGKMASVFTHARLPGVNSSLFSSLFVVIEDEEGTRRMDYRTWLVFNIKELNVLTFRDIV